MSVKGGSKLVLMFRYITVHDERQTKQEARVANKKISGEKSKLSNPDPVEG